MRSSLFGRQRPDETTATLPSCPSSTAGPGARNAYSPNRSKCGAGPGISAVETGLRNRKHILRHRVGRMQSLRSQTKMLVRRSETQLRFERELVRNS